MKRLTMWSFVLFAIAMRMMASRLYPPAAVVIDGLAFGVAIRFVGELIADRWWGGQ